MARDHDLPAGAHGGDSRALPAAVLVLNALIVLAAIAVPWKRLPQFAQIIPVIAYFVVIALLREADGGGMSGYGALSMLPVFWLALYGTREQLAVSIAGVAAVFVVPLLVLGEPEYPSSRVDARAALDLRRSDRRLHGPVARAASCAASAAENLRRAQELQVSQEETRKLVVSMAAVTEATRELARTTDSKRRP